MKINIYELRVLYFQFQPIAFGKYIFLLILWFNLEIDEIKNIYKMLYVQHVSGITQEHHVLENVICTACFWNNSWTSGTLNYKAEIFEREINWKSLGARKPTG